MEVLALKMKNNIKELRKARGLRQEDMARLLGVSRQTIVAMENDKYDPTLELAIKTARLLEQPVESIFFLDEESLSSFSILNSPSSIAARDCTKKGLPAGSPFL